ncbi:Retrovirus-related Pol polyprotein from transposon RE2 [Vitis vinifera]|uniref:Retrovirus-related Pol polyprotein from transposon RE2 n=1 Tax=Vitis vinifera TaxID=29760 RepID=A0A438GLW9_VITVI|nr:Retrovirus-related Pol polyprotein from transposon RE2 [Vitis vinifera]
MAGDDEQPPLPPPKREMNSLFFLGTGDRPGDFITPTHLRGDNYDDWASDIQLALEARRKFEFLEGTITGPQPPYTQSDWNTVNAMLVSWITNTIDPEVKSTLSKFRDAKRLWEHLKQRYAMVNGPRIQQLKTSIAKCEQPKSMSVTTYYGKLNVLWEEFFKHEPLISCTCCSSCTAASLHQARREQGKLHDFLMGLNTDLYAQLRTNILSQDPLPSLDRAYQLVIQDERVRLAKAVTEDKPAEVLGFAVRTGARRGRGKTERPVCSHCKKTGHETSTCWSLVACPHCHKHGHDKNNCYEIVGYPEGWLDQNKADGGVGRSRQQAGRGRGSARANAASSTVGASSTKSSTDQLFTPEQWKALAGLIGNAQVPDDRLNGKFDTKSWIIDIGATHHVTGDLSWLFDTITLFECPVGLPNGEFIVATQSSSDHTRELIGTGVRRDGLYYFGGAEGDSVQHVSVHNAASTLELWHKRMGHPSEKVVKLLPPVSNLKGDKFASRSRKCVFLGYPFGKKGWKLFDLDTKELFVSRDVKFFEDVFPFGNPGAVNIIPDNIVPTVTVEIDSDFADFVDDDADLPNPQAQTQNPNLIQPEPQAHQDQVPYFDADLDLGLREGGSAHTEASSAPLSPGQEVVPTVGLDSLGLDNTSNGQSAPMGKGMRDKFPSVLLRDFVTHTVVTESPSPATPSPQHPSGTPYPIAHYINCDNFSVHYRKFLAAIISSNDPKSFKEAMKDVGWQKSMHEEIRALEENGTWTLEPLPKGKRALGSQWVYRTKYFSNGDIERLKSRLVVLGNHQEVGIDYHETFSPVAKMTTMRAFLAIAASKNWELHQMDVHNAFLHGDLEEKVYMKLPPGFERSDPNLVCRLRKSLYGLKQAPRCWFAKLVTALKGYGFLQSYSDYSLFTYTKGNVQINVLVYVDDFIISGNDSAALKTFKAYLSDCFKMKDLGVLKYFLGIEVARSSAGLFLCQRKYTLDIVSEAGLLGAKPCGFPIEQNHRLGLANGELLSNPESYRRLVGRLIYLAVTHPDLAYSVHILSQFMQEPRIEHWEAALRVVRYLKGTPGQGILLRADSDLSLQGWCDSDWAACPVTRRSLSGWLVFLGQSPISWKTKKQHIVSRSSAEAEYRAMAAVTCELKWLKGLLLSLGVHNPKAIKLFCDSQSALHMAKNPVFHERTKHIEVDCHFVRDAITDGLIAPSYVPTVTQLADIFTKALGKKQFDYLLAKLGIFEPHAPT